MFSKESQCADRTAYQGLEVAKCTGFTIDTDSVDTVNVAELLPEDHLPAPHCKPITLVHVAMFWPRSDCHTKSDFEVHIEA